MGFKILITWISNDHNAGVVEVGEVISKGLVVKIHEDEAGSSKCLARSKSHVFLLQKLSS